MARVRSFAESNETVTIGRKSVVKSIKAKSGPIGKQKYLISWISGEESWMTYKQLRKYPGGIAELTKMNQRQKTPTCKICGKPGQPQYHTNNSQAPRCSETKPKSCQDHSDNSGDKILPETPEVREPTPVDEGSVGENLHTDSVDLGEIDTICEFRSTPYNDKYLVSLKDSMRTSWVSPDVVRKYLRHLNDLLEESRLLEESAAERRKQLESKLRGVEKYKMFLTLDESTHSSNTSIYSQTRV